ncbi:hypothetical protein AUP68_06351 [Ilyonectria robusta]
MDLIHQDSPDARDLQAEIENLKARLRTEDGFYSSAVDVEPIRTRIPTYLPREKRDLYMSNTFFDADGCFSAAPSADGALKLASRCSVRLAYPDTQRTHPTFKCGNM